MMDQSYNKTDRFVEYNKKRPVIRVTHEEKEILLALRNNQALFKQIQVLLQSTHNNIQDIQNIKPKITKMVTSKPLIYYKNKDFELNEADQEFLGFLKQIYPESVKTGQIVNNTSLSLNQVKHRLDSRVKFFKFNIIEREKGNKHDGFHYKLNLEQYNLIFDESEKKEE